MPESDIRSAHDPSEQLARLVTLCRHRSVEIYRDQALYLQILREELHPAVNHALFNLFSEVDPTRFSKLPEKSRVDFHNSVNNLVQRSSVLMTVEQLLYLMRQMQNEQRQRQEQVGKEILKGLSQEVENNHKSGSESTKESQEPNGSIELSMAPQIESNPGEEKHHSDQDLLRSLFEIAGDAMHQQVELEPNGSQTSILPKTTGKEFDPLLPNLPDGLIQWMDGMDLALYRRLRNLSHALNVQMLRSGLANALLPVSLLEAVLRGQMETQSAPSNLLRLRLSLAMGDLEPGMDVLCLLLRINELEFDSPRLRHCRRRLTDHRNILRNMLRQQRHWERRCLDIEARTHWQTPSDLN